MKSSATPQEVPYERASQDSAAVETDPQQEASASKQGLGRWFKRVFGGKPDTSLKEALEEAIEVHEEQTDVHLAPEEKVMLHNVLSFSDIKVNDIKVPRTDIIAVPHDILLHALKQHIIEHRHTRIPVYQGTLDHVLGFVHLKDLLPMLSGDKPYDLKSVLRNLLFVPPSMRIIDLLVRMRHAGSHMAIVVDEYGGTDGLVTMENLFEEIVGDIQDEHDEDESQAERIVRISPTSFEVSGRIPIEKLERELDLSLISEERPGEFDTLGGLIFFQLGRIPLRGEIVPHASGTRFEIIDADSRRIRRVRIRTA